MELLPLPKLDALVRDPRRRAKQLSRNTRFSVRRSLAVWCVLSLIGWLAVAMLVSFLVR